MSSLRQQGTTYASSRGWCEPPHCHLRPQRQAQTTAATEGPVTRHQLLPPTPWEQP